MPLSEILRVKRCLPECFLLVFFSLPLQSETKASRAPRALQPRGRDCAKSSAVPRKEPPDSFVSMRLSSAARPKKTPNRCHEPSSRDSPFWEEACDPSSREFGKRWLVFDEGTQDLRFPDGTEEVDSQVRTKANRTGPTQYRTKQKTEPNSQLTF